MIAELKGTITQGDLIQCYYKGKLMKDLTVSLVETMNYEAMIANFINTEKVMRSMNSRSKNIYDVLLFEYTDIRLVMIAVDKQCDTIVCQGKINIKFEETNEINFPKLLYLLYNGDNAKVQLLHEKYTETHQELFLPFSGIVNDTSLISTNTFNAMLNLKSFKSGSTYYSNLLSNYFLGGLVELNYVLKHNYMLEGTEQNRVGCINIPYKMK